MKVWVPAVISTNSWWQGDQKRGASCGEGTQAGNEKEEPDLRCRSGSCSAAGLRGREEPGATPRNRVNGDAAKRPWHVGQERD